MALSALAEGNPKLQIEDYLVMDVIVGHAVRLAWLDSLGCVTQRIFFFALQGQGWIIAHSRVHSRKSK